MLPDSITFEAVGKEYPARVSPRVYQPVPGSMLRTFDGVQYAILLDWSNGGFIARPVGPDPLQYSDPISYAAAVRDFHARGPELGLQS